MSLRLLYLIFVRRLADPAGPVADYLVENDGRQWSLTAGTPPARADVTITATTQALTAFIFAGSDTGIDITGKSRAVERFRRLISTMATVVHPV